jgi:hypothetical protein
MYIYIYIHIYIYIYIDEHVTSLHIVQVHLVYARGFLSSQHRAPRFATARRPQVLLQLCTAAVLVQL